MSVEQQHNLSYAAPAVDTLWSIDIDKLEDLLYCPRALTDVHYRQCIELIIEAKHDEEKHNEHTDTRAHALHARAKLPSVRHTPTTESVQQTLLVLHTSTDQT